MIEAFRTPTERAYVPPVYRMGSYRQGIASTAQQPAPGTLVTDGFASTQATAARAVAARVSDLEFRIQTRAADADGVLQWGDDPAHPLLAVLDRPNPLLSRRQMLKLASYWLSQAGECFWLVVTNGAGKPVELWPMGPQNVEKLSSDIQPVSGFVFHGEGGQTRYGLEEVVWMFDPDPSDPFVGVGVVGPQAREFDSAQFASSTMREHFKNDATPKVVLKADTESDFPTPAQREMFWADWQNRYNRRGGEHVGVPAFLPSGFEAQELQGGGNLSEIREFMEYERDVMLMANGVPRSILGDVVDANRAAADTNRLVFDRHTIKPQTGLVADALTHQLAVPHFGVDTRVAFEDFIADDEDLRLREESQDLTLKVRSINQVRADRGLDPVEWGDDPVGSFGDVPYEPDSMPDDDPEPEPEPDDDDDDQGDDDGRAFVVPMVSKRIAARVSDQAEWARLMNTDAVYVPRMLSALRRVFAGQKAMTIAALEGAGVTSRGFARADWIDDLFASEEMSRLFDTLVTPIGIEVYSTTGSSVLAALEERPQLAFNEKATREMRDQGAQLVTLANETTKKRLRTTLAKGIEAGESLSQLTARTRKAYKDISKGRARTIARTEVGYAMSKGQHAGFEQSASVFYTKWNTALDERVRDQHVAMQGVTVREGETFTIPPAGKGRSEKALGPRVAADGGRLSPANGINCRCFESAVLGE